MTEQTEFNKMLELMSQPAFCVKDGIITQANRAAKRYLIEPGTPVAPMLGDAAEEYGLFRQGCLFLNLFIAHQYFSASVTPVDDQHVFVLDPEEEQPSLRALALAAQELRKPVSDLMAITDRLFPELEHEGNDRRAAQVTHMNHSLYQLLRIVFNMSDASRYSQVGLQRRAFRNIGTILEELFEKAAELVEHRHITLNYQGLMGPVRTMVDEEKLERAVLNMISNAMKYTGEGGTINARLARRGDRLFLSVQDDGSGVPDDVISHMHRRYERAPALEDPRHGLGLGMAMIRSCATAHGGSVMVTHPEGTGARITMTIAVWEEQEPTVRTKVLRPDYAGERNHLLLELADCLPVELYATEY